MAKYRWLSLRTAKKYLSEAKKKGVSKVARSKSGFFGTYQRAKTASKMKKLKHKSGQLWSVRRQNFLKRHLVQHKKKPTRRRCLAMIMWAYKPSNCPAAT